MKINLNTIIQKPLPSPSPALLAQFENQAARLLAHSGEKETALMRRSVKPFARILFDIGDSSLACWRAGRPVLPESEYAPATQGLLFSGNAGTGKSTIMRIMAASIHAEYLAVPALGTVFLQQGTDGLWNAVNKAECWDLFLDDLGAEKEVKSYSNAFPIEELIYKRYDMWQRHGIRTHFSTNCTGDQIEERYGLRIRDRIKEMTTLIVGTGKSMRK